MKKTIAMILTLALVFSLCISATAESVVLKVNMSESAEDNKAKAIDVVCANITERTEGRVTFEIYHNGELGSFADDIEAIAAGANIVDGTSGDAYAPYGCDDMTALNLMYIYQSPEEVTRFNSSDLFKEMCDELEANSGIKMLCENWSCAPRCVLSTTPINTVEDFKGKIIRVPLAPYVAFFTRLGCSTQKMTMAETYTAMQQGTVDACEFPLGTIYTNSLYEVGKYIYLSEHTYAPCCWSMSSAIFNGLSAEDQAVVMEEFEKGGDYFTQLNLDTVDDYKAKLTEAGVTFVTPSDSDKAVMSAAAADAVNDFPELSDGLIERIYEALGR